MTDKPWLAEPNELHWINNDGQECLILRHNLMNHLCGYVRADKLIDYNPSDLIEIVVHGGVTFSGTLPNYEGWWIGFDCAHHNDFIPNNSQYNSGIYRNIEYVKNEVECMAYQLSKHKNMSPNYDAIRDRFYNANIIVPRSLEEFLELTNRELEFDCTFPDLNVKETEDEIIITLCYLNVALYPYEVKAILADYSMKNPTLDKIIVALTGESE